MGRWSWSSRQTVEECRFLSVSHLKRWGVFNSKPGDFWTLNWTDSMGKQVGDIGLWVRGHRPAGIYLQLVYTTTDRSTGKKQSLDYTVGLDTTPCNFGGLRYWFTCPLTVNGRGCYRRVGRLYLPGNAIYFGCRHCYNLTYRSCKEHDKRVSVLAKLPPGELERLVKSRDPKASLLGLKALFKKFDK